MGVGVGGTNFGTIFFVSLPVPGFVGHSCVTNLNNLTTELTLVGRTLMQSYFLENLNYFQMCFFDCRLCKL